LLVDDNEMLRTLAARNLELDVPQLRAVGVSTCEEARRRVTKLAPDIMVLDQMLVDGTGLDLMRELASDIADTPVVVVSAEAGSALRQRALEAGAFAVLSKPYEAKALADIVIQALDQFGQRHKSKEPPAAVTPTIGLSAEVVARVRHRAINRLAALVAGLRAFEADLMDGADDRDAMRQIMDQYFERLLQTAADISELLRDLRPNDERDS
jgi:DNA-binding NtrC family response regulator